MIGVLIIVIVAVIAVAILLETPHHARGTTATSTIIHNSSGANSNSIQTGSNSTQQSRVEAELCSSLGGIVGSGGGAGSRYISENESAALVGSGGEYYECAAIFNNVRLHALCLQDDPVNIQSWRAQAHEPDLSVFIHASEPIR